MDDALNPSIRKRYPWNPLAGRLGALWSFILWGLRMLGAWSLTLKKIGQGNAFIAAAPPISSVFRNAPRKINEHLYEIRRPTAEPTLVVIFFHGFELGEYREAYWTDWVSADRSHCWLETWLGDEFPEAWILSVSYDSSLQQTSKFGRVDLHTVAETLLYSLTTSAGAEVAHCHCPIVLVGHSVGGLVMKKLLLTAAESSCNAEHGAALESFLSNIKGLFFYATPHSGSSLAKVRRKKILRGALVKDLQVFERDPARLHDDFSMLQSRFQWKLHGLGELHETLLDGFHGVVVELSSAMHGMARNFKVVPADHINICKPDRKESLSFSYLEDFMKRIVGGDDVRSPGPGTPPLS